MSRGTLYTSAKRPGGQSLGGGGGGGGGDIVNYDTGTPCICAYRHGLVVYYCLWCSLHVHNFHFLAAVIYSRSRSGARGYVVMNNMQATCYEELTEITGNTL